jgi:hypothetical protein
VRLEGLGQLKNPVTSTGIEPGTFWLVALRLNQLRYSMVYIKPVRINIKSIRQSLIQLSINKFYRNPSNNFGNERCGNQTDFHK